MAEEWEAVVSSSYGWRVHLFYWDKEAGLSRSKCGRWVFPGRFKGVPEERVRRVQEEVARLWLGDFPERCRKCFKGR